LQSAFCKAIFDVMTTSTRTLQKTDERSKAVLGRSPVTGQFVMRPASKVGTVTLRDAKIAVSKVRNDRKN
jgi:hypothetical protein